MPLKDKAARKQYQEGYWKKYYSDPERKARHLASVRKTDKQRSIVNQRWVNEYKIAAGCKVCGFKEHPSALDFDHRNPAEKKFNIAEHSNQGWSLKTIKEEAAKCDVLCANHHRMKHAGALV